MYDKPIKKSKKQKVFHVKFETIKGNHLCCLMVYDDINEVYERLDKEYGIKNIIIHSIDIISKVRDFIGFQYITNNN
jgi:hypothetical protein